MTTTAWIFMGVAWTIIIVTIGLSLNKILR